MSNRIALVSKDLHTSLFHSKGQHFEDERPKIYRRQPLPPQLMLKSMIKKGLSSTQHQFLSRPKTATSNFIQSNDGKNSLRYLRPSQKTEQKKISSVRKSDAQSSQSPVDFNMNIQHPQECQQLSQVLKQLKWQKEQEEVRKRLKLEKYGQRKFNYAWRRYNIPA